MTTIPYYEALGYRAIEQGENPHQFWQKSEHLKREQYAKSMDNPRRQHPKGESKNGEILSGNIRNSSKNNKISRQPDKEIGAIEGNNSAPSKGKAPHFGKRRNYRKPDRD